MAIIQDDDCLQPQATALTSLLFFYFDKVHLSAINCNKIVENVSWLKIHVLVRSGLKISELGHNSGFFAVLQCIL